MLKIRIIFFSQKICQLFREVFIQYLLCNNIQILHLPRLAPKLFADGVSKNFHVNLKSIVENKIAQLETQSRVFTCSRIFTNFAYEGTENMFYFFYKISIFRLNKEKDDIRSKRVFILQFLSRNCNFSQLGDRAKHIAHVIFVLHSAI